MVKFNFISFKHLNNRTRYPKAIPGPHLPRTLDLLQLLHRVINLLLKLLHGLRQRLQRGLLRRLERQQRTGLLEGHDCCSMTLGAAQKRQQKPALDGAQPGLVGV